MGVLVAFSYCGEHIKSVIGKISPIDHAKGLLACMDNIGNKYPLLVSATKFTIDLPDENERMLNWEIFKRANVISTKENPGHQHGACWSIRYAIEFAGFMGYDYLFFTSDDVLFRNANVVADVVNIMKEKNLGYFGSNWGENESLNTQVFCIKVDNFVNIAARKFLINPRTFAGYNWCLEHYMYSVVIANGIRYEANYPRIMEYVHTYDVNYPKVMDYFHTHDMKLLLTTAKTIQITPSLKTSS